jgi:tetratricopeptide (TPR) repeat protein
LALDDFNNAIQKNPLCGRYFDSRARIYVSLNQNNKALDDFNKVIELHPTWSGPFVSRGQFREGQGNLQAALRDYNHAIELNPMDLGALSIRGKFFIQAKPPMFSKAVVDINRALKIYAELPQDQVFTSHLLYHKARCLCGLGRVDEAIETLEKINSKIGKGRWQEDGKIDKEFDSIRLNPRFIKLIK